MMNTKNMELNMDELAMVTGGTDVMVQTEVFNDGETQKKYGIPRGGRVV